MSEQYKKYGGIELTLGNDKNPIIQININKDNLLYWIGTAIVFLVVGSFFISR